MKARGLERKDAEDRAKWRALSWEQKANSHNSVKNGLKTIVVVVVVVVVVVKALAWIELIILITKSKN